MTDKIEDLVLDREKAISNGVDPFGTKWVVTTRKGYSLYYLAKYIEDKGPVIPDTYPKTDNEIHLNSAFTTPARAQNELNKYLNWIWDKNDRKAKREHIKEHQQKFKADKSKED